MRIGREAGIIGKPSPSISRRSGTQPLVALSLFGLVMLLGVGLLGRSLYAADEKEKKADKKKGVYELKMDGYVEKIDPSIDYKARLRRIMPRDPAGSLKGFHIIEGFKLELAASEPLVRDPVDLAFDENGRMYVAEMIPYAENNSAKFGSPNGRVSLLEDTDGDGRYDKSQVFLDKVVWPTGVTCFDGGIFVAAAPELLYCKDTDGDGKADVREVVLDGFRTGNPNGVPNSLRWSLDSRIEGMPSTSGGRLKAVYWEKGGKDRKAEAVESRGRDFSIHPRSGEMRLESGGSQYGMTFDQWGRKFESSNSSPLEMVMYEDRYIARNQYLAAPAARTGIWADGRTVYRKSPVEPWRILRTELRVGGTFTGPIEGGKPSGYFTGACGVTIYTGNAWPKLYQGNSFTAEGSSNIVHRMRLDSKGVGFRGRRTEKEHEFIASEEVWFRPVQFAVGPDGNLYMADMYREVYEHPGAVPPSAKMHIDLSTGNDRGRIWRIVHDKSKKAKPARLGTMSTAQLVALLAHPNRWHRVTASRLLYERNDPKAVEPLAKLAAASPEARGRMHAMYVLAGVEKLTADVVLARLADEHPRVREHAVRLAERVLADSPAVREKLAAMAGDDDMRVRYQLAFTLGDVPGAKATEALAQIAARDVGDRWIELAVLSSSLDRAGDLFAQLAADSKWRDKRAGRNLLERLAQQAGLQARADQVAIVFKSLEGLQKDEKQLTQAAIRGLLGGLEKSGSPLRKKLATGGKAQEVLAEMVEQSLEIAADDKKPIKTRVEAIRSLGLASFDQSGDALGELLDGRQPQDVQMAALQTLGRFSNTDVAEIVVHAWGGFSPNVRGEAAETLFARSDRLDTLLSAIEDKTILPSQLDPARIKFLTAHPNKEIRARADKLLGGVKLARREQAVKAYQDALTMKADRARGKEVFKRECATCHKLEGVGFDLGLPLESIQNRGREGIMLQILDPNREVNPSYLNYVIVTNEGLSKTGMISAETATSITLNRAEGESDTILRANIDELVNTGLSIMPEGLEKQVKKQEMADLLEYLMTVK